ncbi:MAG: N-acetylmuramoyl-L-alanine amidase [Hominimerdicola sp.]
MFKKIQTLICCAVVLGFMFLWGAATAKNRVVMTSGNINTGMDKQVIVLDAGHGGLDGGCVSVNGVAEKGINLAIMESLRDGLEIMGYDVICTRESDISIHDKGVEGVFQQKKSDMDNRLAIFNKYSDAISVSIHQNQFTDGKYSGAQMFYSEKNSEGEKLAEIMKQQFVSLLQPDNTRETKPVGDELYLLNNTTCPSVLVECGFLSNAEEAAKLESSDYQKKVAFTIMTGIFEYSNQRKS